MGSTLSASMDLDCNALGGKLTGKGRVLVKLILLVK